MKNPLIALGMLVLGMTSYGANAAAANSAASDVPPITGVQIVAADDFAPLQILEDGDNVVLADMPDLINMEAVSENPEKTGSVKFVLDGPKQLSRVENTAIYTMANAYNNLDLRKGDLPEGSYLLWVTPYSGANATGQAGATYATTFTVSATQPVNTVPAITGLQVVSGVDYSAVQTLSDGDTLILEKLPNLINIEALSADTSKTGSVDFTLNGPKTIQRAENNAIYTLENSYYNLDLSANGLPEGDYSLSVTPWSGPNKTGDKGETFVARFSVSATVPVERPIEEPSTVPAITGIQVVSGETLAPVQTLKDGGTLVLENLPNLINLEAVSADVGNTGSVDFTLNGPRSIQRFENTAIYTLENSYYNLDLSANALPEGTYSLAVTPWSGADKTGDKGKTFTINFTVRATEASVELPEEPPVGEYPSKVPAITAFQVISGDSMDPIKVIQDGDVLTLDTLPTLINFEAVSADTSKTGSVDFVLQGPKTIARMENNAIYTLENSFYNLDLSANGLPVGNYTLSATPYSGADTTGDAGRTLTVRFSVEASSTSDRPTPEPEPLPEPEPEPELPVSKVPAITGLRILDFTSSDFKIVSDIAQGATIDLAQLPQMINIEAVSANADLTGSVAFALEGPKSFSRSENTAIYTMADAYHNMNIVAGDLPAGRYTLSVTPYAGSNMSGEKGHTFVASFTVTGKPEVPVVEAPVANPDNYSVSASQTLSIGRGAGVISNDTGDNLDTAQVSLVKQPRHGALVLNSNGSFTYTPDYQFAGIDSFSYSLVDANGGEATATVTLTVTEASGGDNNGFTPIIASDDTRTVYVSSSEGLDSNNGFSINAPVKTLDKAFSLVRAGYPDHVLLKRGDTWVNEDLNGVKSGRSKSEPAVVAFYGKSGDRPYLKTSGYTLSSAHLDYVNFIGLSIEAYKLNPDDRSFDGRTSANIRMVGDFQNILFEDMKLRFIEFVIQGYNGKKPRDIHIRRSMILDKYSPGTSYNRDSRPSGIYTDNGEGLTIEESLWDHNGWNAEVPGAGANMFNHNMYISERNNVGNKIVIRDNIVTRASALGIHGRPGGRYENNFFGRNAIGMQMGYKGGPALEAGTIAYSFNNVVSEGLNMDRGVDSCSGANLCTKAIWGIQVENLGNADVRVEGNIVSNRMFEYEGYVKGIRDDNQAKYSDNIVYRWDSASQGTDKNYPDPGRTLADYNASLGGERSFEAFIETARNRGLQQWDQRYTADAVNDYIRAGFGR